MPYIDRAEKQNNGLAVLVDHISDLLFSQQTIVPIRKTNQNLAVTYTLRSNRSLVVFGIDVGLISVERANLSTDDHFHIAFLLLGLLLVIKLQIATHSYP